jgi:GMP synthase (glutamine-hydrolysing)
MARRPVLILKAGSCRDVVDPEHGDFEDWIAAGLGHDLEIAVCRVREDERPPPPEQLAAAVVTGSSAMVSDHLPWSEGLAAWLAEAVAAQTPLLGICYGHQVLAHGCGGVVAPNPRGREIGTATLRLTAAAEGDPLLAGLPQSFPVQTTHLETVLELPGGAIHLGVSDGDPHQAFRIGRTAWGLQFHPEFAREVMCAYLASRREVLEAEGFNVDALIGATVECVHGATILHRFGALVAAL